MVYWQLVVLGARQLMFAASYRWHEAQHIKIADHVGRGDWMEGGRSNTYTPPST